MAISDAIRPEDTTEFLLRLLRTPSPSGDTGAAISLIETEFRRYGLETYYTRKGALLGILPGQRNNAPRACAAHVDTLGAMVKEIKKNGCLKLDRIGGYPYVTIDGEYCTIATQSGQLYSGTILPCKASVHVHSNEVADQKRELDTMEVRIDERTTCRKETEALGIQVGDFIYLDPRAVRLPNGFIKSRHLDNKAGVAVQLGAIKALHAAGRRPAQTSYFFVSPYEEVGHGAAHGIPTDTHDLLVIDMGALGEGQAGDEYSVSICAKDGSGPYDLTLRRHLVRLAQQAAIPYKLDIYRFYSSDGSAAWRAGGDYRVGLIGPGVDASHSYERTHEDGIVNSARLLTEFLCYEGEY
jgi:putative aminopeptidase FrvX